MEKLRTKIFLTIFLLSAIAWIGGTTLQNLTAGKLLEFGTIEFKQNLTESSERAMYSTIAEAAVIRMASYPLVLIFAFLYLRSTSRSLKLHGWLMMSAILLFIFIPVEAYCMWLEWKIVGLQYWGTWPIDEFRKTFLARITALAGLPLIATLCYYTIIALVIFRPMKKKELEIV